MSAEPERPPEAVDRQLLENAAKDFYENAPVGYLTVRADGSVVRVNETFLRWTGLTKECVVGSRLQNLLTVAGKIYYETHLAPLLRMQGEVSEVALDFRCCDERTLPALINIVSHGDAREASRMLGVTVVNATERRRYERELMAAKRRAEDAAKLKADLLAMLGHDIRTPLGAIMNVVKLLESMQPADHQRPLIEILRRSSDSLASLINDILQYSQLDAGRLPVERKPFSLRSLLNDLEATTGTKAEEKKLELSVEIEEGIPDLLFGDPVKLLQVLINLTGNSIKFTTEGGVRVLVKKKSSTEDRVILEFAVKDTGVGIAGSELRVIFEEFAQANADIGMKYGGTGLGLAISRKLLTLLGSEIRVESAPGQGSSFAFQVEFGVLSGAA